MKKQSVILLVAMLTIIAILVLVFWNKGMNAAPTVKANSALLVSLKHDKTLFEENTDQKVPIASLTKLMTAYLVLESIHNKQLSWDEGLTLKRLDDPRAVSLQARTGKTYYSVQDLFATMMIMSANDAAEALAERVNSTDFVGEMNAKAKELGLKKTKYVNATGLDNNGEESMSTAGDLLILAKELISDYPEILETTSRTSYVTKDGNTVHTTNDLLQENAVDGLDGLKTGFTDQAGYCLIATAVQNGDRLIAVVLGSRTDNNRMKSAETLLDYGFSK
ncbi:D-alanyl-D-alanine carboxypeptidase family protein [Listeria booriae]|uniref:D-alanyl-D-alanine carboxypeptidase family protein n=1 Tax=Listeria booriae TaxID=1552123 RepID=UPI0016286E53|nr:D-alanyl-D-alanine carboxypeptidase family protein [Listeria booriae]MBC1976333.1 D-alanyl-D-alanine carboxypeptidase [Listeria booriae]MBC2024663.1 D-alanyl-D-alanine carboxypeptidase [Listeria booriae]MBC2033108.1 D-alanyl-D-alanine carboxypeptidase [Listeria booriae]MBC2080019.1 D-alanyl-D-alanine carboxypeptidase [Listeria booriae]